MVYVAIPLRLRLFFPSREWEEEHKGVLWLSHSSCYHPLLFQPNKGSFISSFHGLPWEQLVEFKALRLNCKIQGCKIIWTISHMTSLGAENSPRSALNTHQFINYFYFTQYWWESGDIVVLRSDWMQELRLEFQKTVLSVSHLDWRSVAISFL